ncbi:dCTP deaminase [Gammaproteobacteria bacterium]
MKLSDVDIIERLGRDIVIDPPPTSECFGSFSIDLRLSNTFRIFEHSRFPYLDLGKTTSAHAMSEQVMRELLVPEDGAFYLHPGELALGMTLERVTLPNNLAGWLDGRSSLARVGLMVHLTAHTIDPGWDGCITLEFFNSGRLPLALYPRMRICAISFEPLTTPTSRPYYSKRGAKYIGQDNPLPSRISKDGVDSIEK